jgi:hypothetical protein
MATKALIAAIVLLFGCAAPASTAGPDVRIVHSARDVEACELVGNVSDDDLDDLMKKAAKKGGTHVLIAGSSTKFSFPFPPRQVMNAQAYRCP